jgi:hypothetical protein
MKNSRPSQGLTHNFACQIIACGAQSACDNYKISTLCGAQEGFADFCRGIADGSHGKDVMAGAKKPAGCKTAGGIKHPAGGQFTANGYYFSDHFAARGWNIYLRIRKHFLKL